MNWEDWMDCKVSDLWDKFEQETVRRGVPAKDMLELGQDFAMFLRDEATTRLDCYRLDGED